MYTKDPKKIRLACPDDRTSGVGTLLSPRVTKTALMNFGSGGARACWVRLSGPTYNPFVLAVYMSHRGRVKSSQENTITDTIKSLKNTQTQDFMCMLGDLNE